MPLYEKVRNVFYRQSYLFACRHIPDYLKYLSVHIHASVFQEFAIDAPSQFAKIFSRPLVFDDAQERHKDLIQAGLNCAIYQALSRTSLVKIAKTKQEKFVANCQSLLFVVRQK